jgi:exopolyphosphatase/guanosine-5'-triphosphate,3'-diphosphate pyrophosphatase
MGRRGACIDIGSNTTRLLVAELDGERAREILADRAFTRIGAALGPDGAIAPAKAEEVARVVARQAAAARAAGATTVRAVATAAVRAAPNRDAFVAAVEHRSGVPVEVLDAVREAGLAFAGAIAAQRDAPDGPLGVVDVGGGSSELVCGTRSGGVTWSASVALGSGVLADAHLRSDPPAPSELAALRARAADAFGALHCPRPATAYAVGGSAASLAALAGAVLDHEALARALAVLARSPAATVAARVGLHPERARLLPAGLVLLDEAARTLGVALRIAGGGLREGVVLADLRSSS